VTTGSPVERAEARVVVAVALEAVVSEVVAVALAVAVAVSEVVELASEA